jgi:large subunit ribosomal protein L30
MPKKKQKVQSRICVTLVKSPIGYSQRQKDTVKALGLRRMYQTVEHADSPALRGMIAKVAHLVEVEEK